MRAMLAVAAVFAVAGCDAANNAADNIARQQAKSVVRVIVSERFPGVNVAPVTDCVIDAASGEEILSLAGASLTGVSDRTIETVIDIASRPEAVTCIARAGFSLL